VLARRRDAAAFAGGLAPGADYVTLRRPVFALGTPVLYGCLLMLASCVLYRAKSGAFDRLASHAAGD